MWVNPIKVSNLAESILNVESNIRHYIECKKHCSRCNLKCFEMCKFYIPSMIHLDVMEKRRDELWIEYNTKHKGELRADGGIVGQEV